VAAASAVVRGGGGGRLSWWRGGIGVSAFFACASRCALRPCTRWAAGRTVGVGVLSAPAGFRTLESTIGLPAWFQERPGPAKTRGTAYTWAADTPPCLVFFLFFCLATLFHFLFLSPPFSPARSPVPPHHRRRRPPHPYPPSCSTCPALRLASHSALLHCASSFFRCRGTRPSGLHHDAPTCPDVAATFFHPLS